MFFKLSKEAQKSEAQSTGRFRALLRSRCGAILIFMATKHDTDETAPEEIPQRLPVVPLRDVVVFPHMIFPVLVGRESSIQAVSAAIEGDKLVFVAAQIDPTREETDADNIHRCGTVAKILQVLKLPNGLMKVLVDGLVAARADDARTADGYTTMAVDPFVPAGKEGTRLRALARKLDALFAEYVKAHRGIPNETLIAYERLADPLRKAYYVGANALVSLDTKQALLASEHLQVMLYDVVGLLRNEIEILAMEQNIDAEVHENIQKSQRRFFIREQIRLLRQELGDDEEDDGSDIASLRHRIAASFMPDDVRKKALEELDKLRRMSSVPSEAAVTQNYLEWLLAMPWGVYSADNTSLAHAEEILDADHYGLEKPKQRILEHIAVLNLVRSIKGQILCLVGPPGVGKTSLGRSIARALNRTFTRISLGGVHDESEIRGHRRTYIGSMPGRIVQAVKKAGTANPVILLDEVDKMSADMQGDPAAALLEVLDPEQNHAFVDHYLDVDVDLSKVLFLTTANVKYHIPLPMQDRMEIIELPGYLEHEKLEIARRHLLPKQIALHGLEGMRVRIDDGALLRIVREYTLEAGVRNLERDIATICRKIARRVVADGGVRGRRPRARGIRVQARQVEEFLGVPKQRTKRLLRQKAGSIIGLAWTSAGGDILRVDASIMPGTEKLTLTGQLGDVLKESAQAALSFLRAQAAAFGIDPGFFSRKDIHVHLPEGAIPKDGPSAGLALTLALYSAVTGRVPRAGVAMTGEITLHGDVFPIGGLNEKLLAARRYGIGTVLLPRDNEADLAEVPAAVREGLTLTLVSTVREALDIVFPPAPARGRRSRT
jgi:ATP-dependent Lon protease